MKTAVALILFFSLSSLTIASCQTAYTIDSLSREYQSCLDKGQHMLGCSQAFYRQADSLLNVVYNRLRSSCDSAQKENCRDDQLQWLTERDNYFETTLKKFKKNNPGISPHGNAFGAQDDAMFMYNDNATFVKERVLKLLSCTNTNFSPANYTVEPTGYYDLDNEVKKLHGDTYGYFGDIKVKRLGPSKIVLRLFVCKGAPSYNSGLAMDTLVLTNNKAVFTTEDDTSCRLVFTFYKRGVYVEQYAANINFACGFGHAVVVYGFYKKTRSKIPSDKEMEEE